MNAAINEELKQRLLKSLLLFKKTGLSISNYLVNEMQSELNIAEIFALNCVKMYNGKNCSGKNQCEFGKDATTHDAMQSELSVSKAAVSQTIGGLEKKGYVEREIDRENRRKIVITITDAGKDALAHSTAALDKLASGIINRFGEAETAKLISLINNFAVIVNELENKEFEPISSLKF